MIYALYGVDSYRSRKKVRSITDRFCEVAGGTEHALHIILKERTPAEVEQQVETRSLFREKRLIIFKNPNEAKREVLAYITSKIPAYAAAADVFLVWDTSPTSFSSAAVEAFWDAIKTHAAKTQEFNKPTPALRAALLEEELNSRALQLSASEKRQLLQAAGDDSWNLVQLVEKRMLGGEVGGRGEEADTRQLLFSFTDAAGLRRRGEAWIMFHNLLEHGITPDRILWALGSHIRTLMRVGALLKEGIGQSIVANSAGIHPFVAKKAIVQTRAFSLETLASVYDKLGVLDYETKQGRGDLVLGLEKVVLTL